MNSVTFLEDNNFSHNSELEIRRRTERQMHFENERLNLQNQINYWSSNIQENREHLVELVERKKEKTSDYHIVKSRLRKSEDRVKEPKNRLNNTTIEIS